MNKREFRQRKIKIDEELVNIRRQERNDFLRKIEYDMATRQKDTIQTLVETTVKIVKLEIKELLKELLEKTEE